MGRQADHLDELTPVRTPLGLLEKMFADGKISEPEFKAWRRELGLTPVERV